jgi:hypothetical protein
MTFSDEFSDDSPERTDSAWEIPSDEAKTDGLRKVLTYITRLGSGFSAEKICSQMLQYARDGYIPKHDLISRILDSTDAVYNFRRKDHYIMIVYFIGRLSHEHEDFFSSLADIDAQKFKEYCAQYFEAQSANPHFRDRYLLRRSSDQASRASSKAFDLVKMINYLALPADAVFGADRLIFSGKEIGDAASKEITKYFATYRYGIEPDGIFKSFLTFTRGKGDKTAPMYFTNVLRDRLGDSRLTQGFCIAISNKLYLIGNVGEGSGIETIAISNVSHTRNTMTGLSMSISIKSELLTSRIVFRRISNPLTYDDVGLKRFDDLREELKDLKDFREMIANTIEFTLTRELKLDGKEIEQADMVAEVGKLLTRPKGEPRFKYGDDGKAFNPADSKQYTFNSALREYG